MILRGAIWDRLVCGSMLMGRVVDGHGQLEAEEGMLADMCLRPDLVQIVSTRAFDPRSAVMLTDQTCDDVTIIPLLVHGTTTWFGG